MTYKGYIVERVAIASFISLTEFKQKENSRLRYGFGWWDALKERIATLIN